ncbi:MAG: MogA/MoaB family molybdenum cofactor biosynthesis protein [Desulfovibrionaceae bacterium]
MFLEIQKYTKNQKITLGNENAEIYASVEDIASLSVGSIIYNEERKALFQVLGKYFIPSVTSLSSMQAHCVALDNIVAQKTECSSVQEPYSLAWVTLSDKGSKEQRADSSGPLIASIVEKHIDLSVVQGFLLPDDSTRLQHLLLDLSLCQQYHLIFTTGGTGLSDRDITPNVMEHVLQVPLPGFEIAMMQASMQRVPTAILSRARAGITHKSIIINLPGSPKAVKENLEPLIPALKHAVDKLRGDTSDCATLFTKKS